MDKKGGVWKVLGIIAVIVVVLGLVAGFYIYKTVQQGSRLVELASDESFQADIQAVFDGDCSKLASVDAKINETRETIIDSCKNPILKAVIQKEVKKQYGIENVCSELDNLEDILLEKLNESRATCAIND